MDFFNVPMHSWYALHKRDLPWRNTNNPYLIWLSEIILQQTRIDQGLSYYIRFSEEFPTISDLANASEDQVLKLWQGLGYYSRARNLHATAIQIQQHFNGIFPEKYEQILSLKGVGEYTAAAIASISFSLEYPAIDGNVYRVLSRFFGISDPIDSSAGKKIFKELAIKLIKGTNSGMHNQAIMEFGALQCTPSNPDCTKCPLSEKCYALANRRINELPVKQKKPKQRDRYFNYIVLVGNGHTWLQKRSGNDIWKNLFEFPVAESVEKTEAENFQNLNEFCEIVPVEFSQIEHVSSWKIHLLTHQRIHYRFIRVQIENELSLSNRFIRVNKEDIFNFAVPKLLEEFINHGLFI